MKKKKNIFADILKRKRKKERLVYDYYKYKISRNNKRTLNWFGLISTRSVWSHRWPDWNRETCDKKRKERKKKGPIAAHSCKPFVRGSIMGSRGRPWWKKRGSGREGEREREREEKAFDSLDGAVIFRSVQQLICRVPDWHFAVACCLRYREFFRDLNCGYFFFFREKR